jgi:hypothetical protein
VDKGESNWKSGEGTDLLKVLEVKSEAASLNPFGPLKSARLIVKGLVAPVVLTSQPADRPQDSARVDRLLKSTDGGNLSARADFEPDVLDQYSEARPGDELYLLFTNETETSEEGMRQLPYNRLEGKMRVAYGFGIVLIVYRAHELYQRVGTFRFQGADKWESWRKIRTEQTIHLI